VDRGARTAISENMGIMTNTPPSVTVSDSAWRSPGAHLYFWSLAALAVVLDLASKGWVFTHLPESKPVAVVPGILYFVTRRNAGAVFSFWEGKRWFFIAASLVAVGFILQLFIQSRARQRWFHLLLALVLGGALGNLYDRLVFGTVRDFIYLSIHLGRHELWPAVFNAADMFLVVGVVGLLVGWLFGAFNMSGPCPVARPVVQESEPPKPRNGGC
jgi:signal peptidase II